ncbi:MAG TPA: ABC transporter permease [Blastocatellia bacterium]|jgi:predicted permease|nr:ABC transporter permease [Blastocatellia bacterium]
METLLQDLRYGFRMLIKRPGFAAVAVLSLALGIGANTAIFSFVNAILLRPLPVAAPDELMFVFSGTAERPYSVSSYPDYVDYRDRNEVFSGLAAYSGVSVSMATGDQAESVSGAIVTGNYFDVLGVKFARGRAFLPEENQTPGERAVAIVSYKLWQRRFGGDPGLLGKEAVLNGRSFTVVGIAPANFNGTVVGQSIDIYVPMMMQSLVRPPRGGYSGEQDADLLTKRGPRWLNMVGRLKPGVNQEQAQAAMGTIASQLEQAYQGTNRGWGVALFPVSKGDPDIRSQALLISWCLMAVVGLVLLIACFNVANLLLSRASTRRKEISVRLALGASRFRLVRQLLTESLLLSVTGGVVGLLLALWMTDMLQAINPPANVFPLKLDLSLDGRVLTFSLLLSLATGLVFGLAPAMQASKPDLVPALKDEAAPGGSRSRRLNLRNLLVVGQVAISLVLLISAGLFLKSLRNAEAIDPGFNPDNVLNVPLNINLLKYTKAQGRDFSQQVIEKVESIPGVKSATLARVVPLSGGGRQTNIYIEGQDEPPQDRPNIVNANVVGLRYLETLSIPLLRGRDFTEQDREGAPGVVVVSETFARRFWRGEDPLGKRISMRSQSGPFLEVIGVAKDGKYITLGEEPRSMMYLPLLQNHETGMTMHIRTAGDPMSIAGGVRNAVASLEKNLPTYDMKTMSEQLGSSLFPARMGATLLAVFGLLALLLAAVGIYGVMGYSVARRTREIGIRMALGARRGDVLRLVLKEGMAMVGLGIGVGLIGAFFATRVLANFLYGVSVTDPITFVIISLLLSGVALVASFIPARRATKVDPLVALRYE